MRINVYSRELMVDDDPRGGLTAEPVAQKANTGVVYSAVRLFLHSSPMLHHPPQDDDRSAITFWLPKSAERRERFAKTLEMLARYVRNAPVETGLD